LQIDTDMLFISMSTNHGLLNFVNIDDLERQWPPKLKVFVIFFVILSCDTQFKSKLRRNG